jgi:hypothetical protein
MKLPAISNSLVHIRFSKKIALLGIAALGALVAARRLRNGENNRTEAGMRSGEIDDDLAADIIRRALPSLERARQLIVAGHA